jgi:hypothetical protein
MSRFPLKPEFRGPYKQRECIDVNLGNAPEAFVRAAYGQISGRIADDGIVRLWADRLRREARLRRIDVIYALLKESGRGNIPLEYSDPWQHPVELLDRQKPRKKTKRDIGAVMMYFFNCPGGVNGGMDWANTHAPGMAQPDTLLGFGANKAGYYDPSSNPGFWYRELSDARYAGLDFVLLNTYGPDLSEKRFSTLFPALKKMHDPIKLALFDDTWAWGQPYFGDFWKQKPDLAHTEKAARLLYEAKWRPFYRAITSPYRYLFHGRPLIYFYNAGTLEPRRQSAAVLKRMKEMFRAEFGVEPFVVVDVAYFEDPAMNSVVDAQFTWFTFDLPEKRSHSTMKGVVLDHAMVRWDSFGREHPRATPGEKDLIVKGPEVLKRVLDESRAADILVLASWNDLGEGTGVNRCYDYYYQGKWLEPDYFLQLIRASQFGSR